MALLVINTFFILCSIGIVVYLFYRLINWDIKYKKWLETIELSYEQSTHDNKNRFAQGTSIPDYQLQDSLDGSITNLYNLINQDIILVFMDKDCIYCGINFEEFFYISGNINYYVIFKEEDAETAKEFVSLYDQSLNVYIVDKSVYSSLKFKFMPAFVKVNSNYVAEEATPIPLKAVNFM